MSVISEQDKERVREASDIVEVMSADIPMRQKGRTFWCCCPFHEEKTPSCQVDPTTQRYYCFGCKENGDVFTYVMKRDDIDFPDAVRKLAERAGIQIQETGGQALPQGFKARLKEVCRETREFYHIQLMRGKSTQVGEARSYLGGRNLGGDVPKLWGLGFAPGHGQLVSHLRAKGFSDKEMIEANVAVSYDGKPVRDRFFDRIMFPICNEQGDCIAFGGRVVGSGEPKYLNSQDTPLFKKSQVLFGLGKAKASMAATGCAIVVEGYTDVISLHQAGLTNVVATLGTALTAQHIRLLSRHAGKRIVYLFDGDEAGMRAAERALEFVDGAMTPEMGKRQIELLACTLPDNLDPADFVAAHGTEALREQIDAAKPLIAFGIDRVLERYDLGSAEGRYAAFGEALQILAPIKDSILASEYAVSIAARLQMRENDAVERLSQLVPKRRYETDDAPAPAPDVQAAPPEPKPAISNQEANRRRFEAVFLGLLARNPSLALAFSESLAQIAWHVPLHAQVAELTLDILADDPQAQASAIITKITESLPASASLFVDRNRAGSPESQARYLADELAIGDTEDAIATFRAQMEDPALAPEEYEMLFQAVTSLQKSLAAERAKHIKTPEA